jgi:putative heme transporter
VDREDGGEDGPVYMQVSRERSRAPPLVPPRRRHSGTVVLVEICGIDELHRELWSRPYPFFNPAIGPHPAGRTMEVIDPSSNRVRFVERSRSASGTGAASRVIRLAPYTRRRMDPPSTRRIELLLPVRTILLVAAAVAIFGAFRAIGDTFLIVFVGIFLALVFEFPVRFVMTRTGLSRGLAATVTVLGSALLVTVFFLLLLVPLVGAVRDFLRDLPALVESLRQSDELSGLGDSGAAENVQSGAQEIAQAIPEAISAVLGIAGSFFGVFLAAFTILFICLFLLTDVANLKRSLASVLMPGDDERWLGVWERVTESVSRWAIGVIIIATIAGTLQGVTAWLLGSSYALALGLIAGLLDMIPNIGATIAGFVLVPTLWAEEGITAAIIMLVVVLVYQQLENNILTPKIQGTAVRLSGFFIIVAVTLFGALLGVLGALTAVPLAAMLQIFVQELTKARREQVAAAQAQSSPGE